jgi:hypothetical protein
MCFGVKGNIPTGCRLVAAVMQSGLIMSTAVLL